MLSQNYVGIDCHEKQNTIALYHIEQDCVSRKMKTSRYQLGKIENSDTQLLKKLRFIEREFGLINSIGYEAGVFGYNIYRRLTTKGYSCKVIAPHTVPRQIGRNKNDRIDAIDIAESLFTGKSSSLIVPSPDQEKDRAVVRKRLEVVRKVTRIKNQISHFMKIHDITYIQTKYKWTKTFYKWLYSYKCEDERLQFILNNLILELNVYEHQLENYNELIEKISKKKQYAFEVKVLSSLRGIGIYSAMVWITEIIDIRRFPDAPSLMSYTGNTPMERLSDGKGYKGRVTKHGNSYLRKITNSSAWHYQYKTKLSKEKLEQKLSLPIRYQIEIDKCHRFLYKKFKILERRKVPAGKIGVAIGRLLTGFVWNLLRMVSASPRDVSGRLRLGAGRVR